MNTGTIWCNQCGTSFPISLKIIKEYGIKCGSCDRVLLKGKKYIRTAKIRRDSEAGLERATR